MCFYKKLMSVIHGKKDVKNINNGNRIKNHCLKSGILLITVYELNVFLPKHHPLKKKMK